MASEYWQRVEDLFMEAVTLPDGARRDFLARTCAQDAGLRDEVTSLLTASDRAGEFLSTAALHVLARQVSHEGWSLQPGDRLASYTVERRLGAGGMGEVWRARDERLGRAVAIKLLLPHPSDSDARVRTFQNEARAASALNHTNVLTVYDVGDHDGAPYLVTECLEGQSLRARLAAGALSVDEALDVALQVTRGLGAAHAHGIVHRDLKPENIFLALDGRVKILDFGLATLHDPASPPSPSKDLPASTAPPLIAGTAGYMAPEQVLGQAVDRRADVFALGVVLYEMLAERRPFKRGSTLETLHAALTVRPPDVSDVNSDVPRPLSDIVGRCLAKSPDDRFATTADLLVALESVAGERSRPPAPSLLAVLLRPAVIRAAVVLMVVVMTAAAWRWHVATSRVRWALTIAPPEVERLSNQGDYAEAFLLARQALNIAPDDPRLRALWLDVSIPEVVTTDPSGADVAFAPYRAATTSWFPVGRTPLNGVRMPRTLIRLRISKAGFQTIEGSGAPGAIQRYRLDPLGVVPPGMVRVVGGRDPARFGPVGELDDYWIDRFEVTNRQFKEFVDRGGYRRRDYWREPFVNGRRSVPWDEAVARFRDATGAQGPATWRAGAYPDGQGEFPVGGVSWYEAAAYAAFAGKSLPTMYHWYRAAALGRFADILTVSNFGGGGPASVGAHGGVGPFGTYDMAGNVKEWCWNETNGGRFLLGGAWNEARRMFADYDARAPFERAPAYGFRLAKYIRPLPAAVVAPVRIETLRRDARTQRPVGDDVFALYLREYAYDRTPLNAVIEATETTQLGRRHSVAFDAAYGGERMHAHLFLPTNVSPPYQTVIFFPPPDAFRLQSSRDMSVGRVSFIIRSGRAVLYPVYKGTYERAANPDLRRRSTSDNSGLSEDQALRIAWSRDLGRAIDYLETRSDIDRTRLAFYGMSSPGADAGVILTALESRLKTSVLQGTGIWRAWAPDIDLLNYAPRVRIPTLLLNGRYDFEVPFDTAQRPLFDLLGTPAGEKRHAVLEMGHALPIDDVAREILPWLDRHLGPVVH